MKTGFIVMGCFFALLVSAVMYGWVIMPFQKASVENVQKQWDFAYRYDESLQAAARQACFAERALTTASSEEEKMQRRTQILAYEQNYARIEAEYNQKLRNAFEAKYIRPSDVPERAPDLTRMERSVCP